MSQGYQIVATEEVGSIPAKPRPFFKRPEVIFLLTVFLSFLLFAVVALTLFYLGGVGIVLLPVAASLFEYLSIGSFGAVAFSGFLLLLGYLSHSQKLKVGSESPQNAVLPVSPQPLSSPPLPTSELILGGKQAYSPTLSPSLAELGKNPMPLPPPRIRTASLMVRNTEPSSLSKPIAEKSPGLMIRSRAASTSNSLPSTTGMLHHSVEVSPNSPSGFGSSSHVWRINRPRVSVESLAKEPIFSTLSGP